MDVVSEVNSELIIYQFERLTFKRMERAISDFQKRVSSTLKSKKMASKMAEKKLRPSSCSAGNAREKGSDCRYHRLIRRCSPRSAKSL